MYISIIDRIPIATFKAVFHLHMHSFNGYFNKIRADPFSVFYFIQEIAYEKELRVKILLIKFVSLK